MYEWNYFYGAIMLDVDYASSPTRNYNDAIEFISDTMPKKEYHYFHSRLFSPAIKQYPFYYDNILISFGRTGKWLFENSNKLREFIEEFEDILLNLDFTNAQLKISSPGINSYTFFWCNKKKLSGHDLEVALEYFDENEIRFFESDNFYFGLGEINLHTGWCEEKLCGDKLRDFDLEFPEFKYIDN